MIVKTSARMNKKYFLSVALHLTEVLLKGIANVMHKFNFRAFYLPFLVDKLLTLRSISNEYV